MCAAAIEVESNENQSLRLFEKGRSKMADQQTRGGKKVGQRDPANSEQRQSPKPESERPAQGKQGGPKPNAGKSRPEHHK